MADLDLGKLSAPLEALRPDVDAAYKRLDAKWKAISKQLSKLPIPCSVTCTIEGDDYGQYWANLEWRKWKGTRRICLASYHMVDTPDGLQEEVDVTPIEEWSGEQRLEMLEHVPALFESAVKRTQEFISRSAE